MALSSTATALLIAEQYYILTHSDRQDYNPDLDFLGQINSILDDAFQNATPSKDNIDITTASGTFLIPPIVDVNVSALNIATAVSNYWALNIATSGTPEAVCPVTPSAIVSVTNTASTIISPLKTAILALGGSEVELLPHFKGFVDAIFDAVKSIHWTVNEEGQSGTASSPVPCNNVYDVTVS